MNKVFKMDKKTKTELMIGIIIGVLLTLFAVAINEPLTNFLWGQPNINVLTFRHDQTILYGNKDKENFYFEVVNEGKTGIDILDIEMKSDKRTFTVNYCENFTVPNFYLQDSAGNKEDFCFTIPVAENNTEETISLIFYTDKGTINKNNVLKLLWTYDPNLPDGLYSCRVYGQILDMSIEPK